MYKSYVAVDPVESRVDHAGHGEDLGAKEIT